MEDMKNTLQIVYFKPRWQLNWPIQEFNNEINQPKIPGIGEILKCVPTKNKIE